MVGEMGAGFLHQLLRDGQGVAESSILIGNGQVSQLSGKQDFQFVRFGLGAKSGRVGLVAEPPENAEGREEAEQQQSAEFFHQRQAFPHRHRACLPLYSLIGMNANCAPFATGRSA